ncbi:MAG: hypothetical protein WC302_03305 [Candidatus Paceibacterota bacterium]|jgi:hypothetical protein
MPTKYDFVVPATELKPGDTVRIPFMGDGAFATALVKRIEVDNVYKRTFIHLYRPYAAHTHALYCGNSVICMVGIEEFQVEASSELYHVYQREELK